MAKQFAEAVKEPPEEKVKNETYGTIVSGHLVLDGASVATPFNNTVSVNEGDRVMVKIVNHQAIVTGNLTSEALDENAVGDKILRLAVQKGSVISEINLEAGAQGSTARIQASAVNNIISQINLEATAQGSTAKIQADAINLAGAVTIGDLSDDAKAAFDEVQTYADDAERYAGNASTSATNASNSASSASTAATNAANSASGASTSAANAANSASSASTYATNAANSASSASTSESNASTYASNASTYANQALNYRNAMRAWCYEYDETYVDGAKIYTGTINTASLFSNDVTIDHMLNIETNNFKLTAGSSGFYIGAYDNTYWTSIQALSRRMIITSESDVVIHARSGVTIDNPSSYPSNTTLNVKGSLQENGISLANKYSKKLMVGTEAISISNLAAGSTASGTASFNNIYVGYSPIGIVGYTTGSDSGNSLFNVTRLYISGSSTIDYLVRNIHGSNSYSCTLTVYVLFVAN